MKFLYGYKTRENEQREGIVVARSRDAAYAELKRQGIHPFRVVLAPGLFNRLQSLGRRWLVILALTALCLALGVLLLRDGGRPAAPDPFDSPVRRQVIGDAAVIETGIATGWADLFPHEGERFLASFALPGVPASQRNTTEEELRAALSRDVRASVDPKIAAQPKDSLGIEYRQMIAIVEGMKAECRAYLADGSSFAKYGRALIQRQEQELSYYLAAETAVEEAVRNELPREKLEALWLERNAELRRMGVRLVKRPESLSHDEQ